MSILRKKAIFLDRDGTIVEDKGVIVKRKDVTFFHDTFSTLRLLQQQYLLFIVTNQSCIGLGLASKSSVDCINRYIVKRLFNEGIAITKVYCCSHKRDDNCQCIKPKSFFLETAQQEFDIDLKNSFTIGDHPHDVEFGRNVGATGLYLLTGHGRKHVKDVCDNTEIFNTLTDAAKRILN